MKKPNVFKRWIYNMLRDTDRYFNSNIKEASMVSYDHQLTLDDSTAIRLNIHWSGGHLIVESRQYDKQRDRTNTNLHVITKDEDFGKGLTRIITMETLRL